MRDLGDFEIEKPDDEPPRDTSMRLVIPGLLLLLLVAGATVYFLRARTEVAAPPAAVETAPAAPATTPAPAPARTPDVAAAPESEPLVLPTLDNSDTLVRELARQLSARPELAAWLAGDEVIRTFAVTVDNIAGGSNPAELLEFLRPRERLRTRSVGGRPALDPRSYARYDGVAAVVASLDATGCAELYTSLKPLITDAYRELGYPDTDFDDTLEHAIRTLLETPVVEGEIGLVERGIYNEFADENLQSLSAVQKQLLAMGPRSVRTVQQKTRELAAALGIPSYELPTATVYQAGDDR